VESHASDSKGKGPPSAHRLLVVDDEFGNRDMLSRRLERRGFAVEVAASGDEALLKIKSSQFDLILLDNMMPGMSGLDLLQLLRATHSAGELPVIMVTAQAESANIVKALRCGANDYVTKPIDFPVVVARIESQLSRLEAERALRASEAPLASMAGAWEWDLQTGAVVYSDRWKKIMGFDVSAELNGLDEWMSRIHPADSERVRAAVEDHLAGRTESFSSEHRLQDSLGAYRWVLTEGTVARDALALGLRFIGTLRQISAGNGLDPATGLANRDVGLAELRNLLETAQSDASSTGAALFVEIDRAKTLNDSLGYSYGSEFLGAVSMALSRVLSTEYPQGGVTLSRFAGDKFLFTMSKMSRPSDATQLASAILASVDTPVNVNGRLLDLAASVGIAPVSPSYESAVAILRDADLALESAKSRGRNRYVVFDLEMSKQAASRDQIEQDLRYAVLENKLSVYYQPKISLATGMVCDFEALVRWNHPTQGMLTPMQFIPIAEQTGLILLLGEWVLREACRQAVEWNKRFPMPGMLPVSVNVSPRQLEDRNLPSKVAAILKETGLPPACLKLEITETAVMEDPERAVAVMKKINELGVSWKLDNFGSGCSPFSHLHRFPFDTLKIDRSFIQSMESSSERKDVVGAIITLAQRLGMTVVAEGVESADQMAMLNQLGCEMAQGFLFSPAVPPEDAVRFIEAAFERSRQALTQS